MQKNNGNEAFVIRGGKKLSGEIEVAGAKNAAVLAVQILALSDKVLAEKLAEFKKAQKKKVADCNSHMQ